MFERFTSRARRVVVLAQEEARILRHSYIGTEHLLLGLLHEGRGAGAATLASMGVTLDDARREVEALVGRGHREPSGHIPFTPPAKKALERSLREALQLSHGYIGTGHLLLGLTAKGDGTGTDGTGIKALGRLGVNLEHLRARAVQEIAAHPEDDDAPGAQPGPSAVAEPRASGELGRLRAEVARLSALLREHGIDPGESA